MAIIKILCYDIYSYQSIFSSNVFKLSNFQCSQVKSVESNCRDELQNCPGWNSSLSEWFFKELKISVFDKALAITLGMKPILIHYMLMSLVSMTAVASFEAVGSILVVAFMIGPPITAYLLTDRLKVMAGLSIVLGSLASVAGFHFAMFFDISIAWSITVVIGIFFLLTLIFSPKKGIIFTIKRKRTQKMTFSVRILLIHLSNHANTKQEKDECGIDTIDNHLRWNKGFLNKVIEKAKKDKYVYVDNRVYKLSEKGEKYLNTF